MSTDPAVALKVTGSSGRSALFLKLIYLYPECEFLIRGADQLHPLLCLREPHCPRNANCMAKLANRVQYVFDTFKDTDLLFLYFRYQDRPQSHRAGVFSRDMTDARFPRYLTFNRSMWDKMKSIGVVYRWTIPDEVFLS